MIARHHAAVAIGLAVQSIDTGWRSAAGAVQVLPTPQPITLAADATTLPSVYRSVRAINRL